MPCPESKYGGQLVSSKNWSVLSCWGFVLFTLLSFVNIPINQLNPLPYNRSAVSEVVFLWSSLPSLVSPSASSFPRSPQYECIHRTARYSKVRVFNPSRVPSRGQDLLSMMMTMWLADGVSLLTRLVTSRMAISSALRLAVGEPTRGQWGVVCPIGCEMTIPLPPVLLVGFVESSV